MGCLPACWTAVHPSSPLLLCNPSLAAHTGLVMVIDKLGEISADSECDVQLSCCSNMGYMQGTQQIICGDYIKHPVQFPSIIMAFY